MASNSSAPASPIPGSPAGARLWLAVAVATLWLVGVGGVAEETIPASTLPQIADVLVSQRRQRRATRRRLASAFCHG